MFGALSHLKINESICILLYFEQNFTVTKLIFWVQTYVIKYFSIYFIHFIWICAQLSQLRFNSGQQPCCTTQFHKLPFITQKKCSCWHQKINMENLWNELSGTPSNKSQSNWLRKGQISILAPPLPPPPPQPPFAILHYCCLNATDTGREHNNDKIGSTWFAYYFKHTYPLVTLSATFIFMLQIKVIISHLDLLSNHIEKLCWELEASRYIPECNFILPLFPNSMYEPWILTINKWLLHGYQINKQDLYNTNWSIILKHFCK